MKIPRDNLDKRFGADEPTSTCGRWNLARGMSDEEGGRVGKGVMGVGLSQCLSLIGAKGPKCICGRWDLERGMFDEEGEGLVRG